MQRGLFVFAAIVILASCTGKSSKNVFKIKGTIINSTAKKIYLEELPPSGMQRIIVDSATIEKSGSFTLKTTTENENIYNIRLEYDQVPVVFLINDAAAVKVNIDLNNKTEYYSVEGSEYSGKMKELILGSALKGEKLDKLKFKMDSLRNTNADDSLLALINNEGQLAYAGMKEFITGHIKNSENPVFTLFTLGSFQNFFSMDEYSGELTAAEKKFPGNKSILSAKQMFDEQVAASNEKHPPSPTNWVGKAAPEFAMPDVNGNEIKLSSFRGKYVLVDFWASWCAPCRQENPNVVKAWNTYKNKNFAILGVSLDRPGQKDNWLKAIKNDNLTWIHVSDLMEWNSAVVSLYKINGIPYNVLIDPDGIIIGEKLFGNQLDEKLAEVLK